MDAATKIYQHILAAGEPGLIKMKSVREPESSLLDFKRAAKNSPPLQQDDKTNLVKAVGGFANTDGGVLVWGVYATERNGIDGVCELVPIENLKQFRNELEDWTPKYVYPLPDGILHTALQPDPEIDRGYVLTLVPAWDGLPVRSTFKGWGSDFYHRVGNEFRQMSHSHLADRFGRRPQPKLCLTGYLELARVNSAISLYLFVTNYGRGLAQKMSVIIDYKLPSQLSGWQHDSDIRFSESLHINPGICFHGHPDEVLHPGLSTRFYAAYERNLNEAIVENLKDGAVIPYRVSCDGFVHSGAIKLNAAAIATDSTIRYEFAEVTKPS